MKSFNKQSIVSLAVSAAFIFGLAGQTLAATATVNLGTADSFAILAGSAITNVPTSVISGNVGLSPAAGGNYSGLTQAEVTGIIYAVDGFGPGGSVNNPGLLTTAKNDLTAAYTDAAGRTGATVLAGADNQLGGQTLTPGVYSFSHATTANLTAASPLTLSGDGVFIFQASSDLITASASRINLINGAQACNVFWTVPSSASSIGSNSFFVGTIMAYSSINLVTGANVQGRVLARISAVTLDHNTITRPATCTAPTTTTTTPATTTTTPTTTTTKATTTTLGAPNTGFGLPASNLLRDVLVYGSAASILLALAFVSRRAAKN